MRRIFKRMLCVIWIVYAIVAVWKFDWRVPVLVIGASYLVGLYCGIPDDTVEESEPECKSCEGCRHNLGGGHCRINVEGECREGGGFELWEVKSDDPE